MISKNDYDIDWSEYFTYDESSPSGLRWKKVLPKTFSIKVGDVAGTKQYRKSGKPAKWMVKFKGKNYSCAKVIYIILKGYIKNNILIDHIDRNPFNNCIDNLREVSEADNLKNKSHQINNTSGFTGVSVVNSSEGKYYAASWTDPITNLRVNKKFSVSEYGETLAKIKAVICRQENILKIDSEGKYGQEHRNYMGESELQLLQEAARVIESQRDEFYDVEGELNLLRECWHYRT